MWNISPAFRAAIQSPVHTMTVKAQVLDTDFNVVVGGTFHDTGRMGLSIPGIAEDDPRWNSTLMGNRRAGIIQPYIVDGSVDVDVARGARRTMNLSLLNPDAEFTPRSDWGGLFYVDRLIRIYRGVLFPDGGEEFVPVGTFMIDTADVVAERNMSIVALTGSDLWKKVNKTKFGTPAHWDAQTPVQTVVKEMAALAGVTRMVLDDLSHRTSQTRNIQAAVNFERGAIIGDELLKFATAWGLHIYFDQLGRFVSEEARLDTANVWTFDPNEDTTLLTVKASYKDEQLYNHVIVTGTADSENPVHAEALDTDPSSPTYWLRIGKRTYTYESSFIATVEQAQTTANQLLAENTKVVEDIEIQSICNPALEGNDVVTVMEPEFTKLNHRLRIQSLNVPLSSSRQTIRLHRTVVI